METLELLIDNVNIPELEVYLSQGRFRPVDLDNGILYAASKGYTFIVQMIYDAGGNVNFQDGDAIFGAISNGHLETLSYLLYCGADPNAQNGKAIDIATYTENMEVLVILLAYGGQPTLKSLEYATKRDNSVMTELLYTHIRPLDIGNGRLLELAIENNNVPMFQYVYDNYPGFIPSSVFNAAVAHDNMEIINILSLDESFPGYVEQGILKQNNVFAMELLAPYISEYNLKQYYAMAESKGEQNMMDVLSKYI